MEESGIGKSLKKRRMDTHIKNKQPESNKNPTLTVKHGNTTAPTRPPRQDAMPTNPESRPVATGVAMSERNAVIKDATIEQPQENNSLNARRLEKKELELK